MLKICLFHPSLELFGKVKTPAFGIIFCCYACDSTNLWAASLKFTRQTNTKAGGIMCYLKPLQKNGSDLELYPGGFDDEAEESGASNCNTQWSLSTRILSPMCFDDWLGHLGVDLRVQVCIFVFLNFGTFWNMFWLLNSFFFEDSRVDSYPFGSKVEKSTLSMCESVDLYWHVFFTPPETHRECTPENRPNPKRKFRGNPIISNHQLFSCYVSFREGITCYNN